MHNHVSIISCATTGWALSGRQLSEAGEHLVIIEKEKGRLHDLGMSEVQQSDCSPRLTGSPFLHLRVIHIHTDLNEIKK